jgi:hypothetical protein
MGDDRRTAERVGRILSRWRDVVEKKRVRGLSASGLGLAL